MSLLFEPNASSFLFEPDVNVEQLLTTDILDLFDDKSWLETDLLPAVPEQLPRTLKRTRPKETKTAVTPKRARRTETRPRLRNKGKIEILRREVKRLEDEVESLQHARLDATTASLDDHRADVLWKIVAMKQSRERERAEQQNKALKTLLTAQCTLTASLSGVFNQWRELPIPDVGLSV